MSRLPPSCSSSLSSTPLLLPVAAQIRECERLIGEAAFELKLKIQLSQLQRMDSEKEEGKDMEGEEEREMTSFSHMRQMSIEEMEEGEGPDRGMGISSEAGSEFTSPPPQRETTVLSTVPEMVKRMVTRKGVDNKDQEREKGEKAGSSPEFPSRMDMKAKVKKFFERFPLSQAAPPAVFSTGYRAKDGPKKGQVRRRGSLSSSVRSVQVLPVCTPFNARKGRCFLLVQQLESSKSSFHSQRSPGSLQHLKVWSVDLSPVEGRIAAGCNDGFIRIWEPLGGGRLVQQEEGGWKEWKGEEREKQMSSSPIPQIIIPDVRSDPSQGSGKCTSNPSPVLSPSPSLSSSPSSFPSILLKGHVRPVTKVLFHPSPPPSSDILVSAGIDAYIRVWGIVEGVGQELANLKLGNSPLNCASNLSFFPCVPPLAGGGDYVLAASCMDGLLRMWNLEFSDSTPSSVVLSTPPGRSSCSLSSALTSLAISPDGQQIVVGSVDGVVHILRASSLVKVDEVECRNRQGKDKRGRKITSLSFSSDGRRLVASSCDSRVRILHLSELSHRTKFKGSEKPSTFTCENVMTPCVFSRNETRVLGVSEDGNLNLWRCHEDEETNAAPDVCQLLGSPVSSLEAASVVPLSLALVHSSVSACRFFTVQEMRTMRMFTPFLEGLPEKVEKRFLEDSVGVLIATADGSLRVLLELLGL